MITGASGFIGTNLVEHYRRTGWEVVNADVAPPRNRDHASYWRKLDILDGAAFRDLVRGVNPTVFIHLAARTDLRGATAADYAANVDGVRNAIAAARRFDEHRGRDLCLVDAGLRAGLSAAARR